ncbi:hypothetical protein [Alkalimarinus alittae]|uniref:Uncharacterized protein n=1 Tax=Alkalimarinus alittae TaxID=2961619 RepID=A0ABY6MY69_9ALTE|nr:hypothetical protein [Alkalimarinus alittae]UZE94779.1 hypothetical protein NKI27_11890 [Alkalimarinus alittae]
MNTLSTINLLAIKTLIIFIASSFTLAQAQETNLLMHQMTQKPLVLDIRFCACKAIDIESDAIEPIPQFLVEATSIKVGVTENDIGFVSAAGLTFGYSISPGKEAGSFVVEYSQEYIEGENSQTSQSELHLDLNSWMTISGFENITDQGNDYFNVAIKLAASEDDFSNQMKH